MSDDSNGQTARNSSPALARLDYQHPVRESQPTAVERPRSSAYPRANLYIVLAVVLTCLIGTILGAVIGLMHRLSDGGAK